MSHVGPRQAPEVGQTGLMLEGELDGDETRIAQSEGSSLDHPASQLSVDAAQGNVEVDHRIVRERTGGHLNPGSATIQTDQPGSVGVAGGVRGFDADFQLSIGQAVSSLVGTLFKKELRVAKREVDEALAPIEDMGSPRLTKRELMFGGKPPRTDRDPSASARPGLRRNHLQVGHLALGVFGHDVAETLRPRRNGIGQCAELLPPSHVHPAASRRPLRSHEPAIAHPHPR